MSKSSQRTLTFKLVVLAVAMFGFGFALVPLYDVPITVIARRGEGINNLESLQGKWLNVGVVRSPVRRAADIIMAAKRWTREDFSLMAELPPSQSQDTMAFSLGSIQAMIHRGVHPDASLERLFRQVEAVFVNLEDEELRNYAERHPAISEISLSAGIYTDDPLLLKHFLSSLSHGIQERLVGSCPSRSG